MMLEFLRECDSTRVLVNVDNVTYVENDARRGHTILHFGKDYAVRVASPYNSVRDRIEHEEERRRHD